MAASTGALQSISFSAEKRVQSIVAEGCLTVKALSLPAGEVMRKHQTANVLYLQSLQGKPKITIYGERPGAEDKLITLAPSMLLRIEANQAHAVEAGEEDALLLLHLISVEE